MLQNLVGQSAVDGCVEAVSFFDLLQRLYAFFVSSTRRWGVLMTLLRIAAHEMKQMHWPNT